MTVVCRASFPKMRHGCFFTALRKSNNPINENQRILHPQNSRCSKVSREIDVYLLTTMNFRVIPLLKLELKGKKHARELSRAS